jgi:hypothetical protein
MRVIEKAVAVVAGFMALAASGTSALADDPSYLTIGAGAWEMLRDKQREPELDLQYRSDYKLWIFKPHAGALVAKDGDYYAYAGLLTDVYWGSHIVTTFSAALGAWGGNGFDLGATLAFRTGGEIAWRFQDSSRLGVAFYHLSNGGQTERNPGSESLLLTYSLPLGHVFAKGPQTAAAAPPPVVATTSFSKVR